MKKIIGILLLSSLIIFVACEQNGDVATENSVADKSQTNTSVKVIDESSSDGNKKIIPIEVDYQDITKLKDFYIETSSVLIDKTNIGFNYEGTNVNDNDFSTAWCAEKQLDESISFVFGSPVQAERVGIMPGFGRDEKIYFQNNRIKELRAIFTSPSGEESEKTFVLPDNYAMYFMELDGQKFISIKFVVEDVYKGSKYTDTCISELDFWSDYVKNEDADAAMNYYKQYKEKTALRPYDIVGEILLSDAKNDSCKNAVKSVGVDNGGYSYDVEDTPSFIHDSVYVSGVINEYGKDDDEVDLKFYKALYDMNVTDEATGGAKFLRWVLVDSSSIKVSKTCDGKLYAHYKYSPFDILYADDDYYWGEGSYPLEEHKVVFLKNGRMIASRKFYFMP